jgi:hypothetical protein
MQRALASPDRLAKDIRVFSVIVAELELGDVQRQVLGTDLMKRTDDTALEDRPETLDGLGMDRTDDVLAFSVVDDPVRMTYWPLAWLMTPCGYVASRPRYPTH